MKFLVYLLRPAAVAAVILTLLLLLGRFHWALGLLTHFRLPCAVGFAVLIALLVVLKSHKYALVVVPCLLLQLLPLSHHYLPFSKDKRTADGPSLKVITFNVLTTNQSHEEVAAFLIQENPDFICLQETSRTWVRDLSPLKTKYPYQVTRPASNNTGLLLLSKLPIVESLIDSDPLIGNPYMIATLDWNGQKLTLINAHPFPPLNKGYSEQLKNTFLRIQIDTAKSTYPTIVVGDFNCTAYAPSFRFLGEELRDSARGRGYVVSWQRYHPLLGIPIDQLLHTDELVCTQRRIGPKLGSDHSPIIATLRIAGNADL